MNLSQLEDQTFSNLLYQIKINRQKWNILLIKIYSNYNFDSQRQRMYMNNTFSQRRIENINQLPVQHQRRRITDICCCGIGVLLGVILFILACVLFSKNNLLRSNYPTDNNGHVCQLDANAQGKSFPFLYFSDLSNPMTSRYCVADCPQAGVPTQAWNVKSNLGYYPNYPYSDRLGSYCFPQDETAREKLIADTKINLLRDSLTSIDVLLASFGISFAISLLWMLLVHYLPRIMVWVAFILAIILLVITAIVFLVDSKTSLLRASGWGIFLGLLAIVIAILLLLYLIIHNRSLSYCSIFLQNAKLMLTSKCIIVLYILLFLVLTILFCILIVFQYLAFSSASSPTFTNDNLYGRLTRNFWWMAPLVIQTLWGLSFLRDAFNFVISGCAVQWYFGKEIQWCYPLKALFTKHFGSVSGGSFLNAFLFIPNIFIDLFCNKANNICCNCLDLPRGDAYPYIYMTGISYCPAVRQVQYLCNRSRICRDNQSTNTFYSLAARLVIALSTTLIAYWIMQNRLSNAVVNPYVLLGVFLMALFVTCYFVDIHVNIAEALMVAFLAEWELDLPYASQMNIARHQLKMPINDLDQKYLAKDQSKMLKR